MKNVMFAIGFIIISFLSVSTASATSMILDGGLGMAWGDFTVKDVNVNIDNEFGHPNMMFELRFGRDEHLGVGMGYAASENEFEGDWDGSDGRHTEGSIAVERSNVDVFFRFIPSDNFNVRLGYRYFKYEFTDGFLQKFQDGELIETAEDASAVSNLTNGFDLELNFIAGNDFQFRFGLGFSYFMDAEYEWEYYRTLYDPTRYDYNEGDATHNAMAIRFKPEIAFKLLEDFRVTLDYTLSGAIWDGSTDEADIEDYAGVELYSAFAIGIEWRIPFTSDQK